jgi:hypothetical protein
VDRDHHSRGARAGGRIAALLALSALAIAGCGNRVSNEKPLPSATDRTDQDVDDTDPADDTAKAQGDISMSDTERDIAFIQEHHAKELNLAKSDIKVRVESKVKVPGITVFSAVANPARAGRNIHRSGIVDGGAIYTEREAMARVAKAWSYGAQRTVSAAEFAKVMGFLHSSTHGTAAIIDSDTLDVFKSTAYPKQAAAAALPRELTVDGLPAVQYCITSGARTIPFSVVTAVVQADYQVELRVEPIMSE